MLATFVAAILSAVAGFGGATVLLPVFVALFGARDAVVILTVTQLVSNGSRAWLNRAEVDVHVAGWFALGAVPAAIIGGLVFATAPVSSLSRVVGVVLLVLVAWRHVRPAGLVPALRTFAGIGAISGFGSALAGSVGPLTAPFFLAYGLTKRAYIGTEATAALVMHVTKMAVYGTAAILATSSVVIGLGLAPATVAGTWVGSRMLDRLPRKLFLVLVELALAISGLLLLFDI